MEPYDLSDQIPRGARAVELIAVILPDGGQIHLHDPEQNGRIIVMVSGSTTIITVPENRIVHVRKIPPTVRVQLVIARLFR